MGHGCVNLSWPQGDLARQHGDRDLYCHHQPVDPNESRRLKSRVNERGSSPPGGPGAYPTGDISSRQAPEVGARLERSGSADVTSLPGRLARRRG